MKEAGDGLLGYADVALFRLDMEDEEGDVKCRAKSDEIEPIGEGVLDVYVSFV